MTRLELYQTLLWWSFHRAPLPEALRERVLEHDDGALREDLMLCESDSLLYLACALDSPAQRLYDKLWQSQRRAAHEAVAAMQSAGARPLVFKGTEIVARYYEPRALHYSADFDVLVDRPELAHAVEAMRELGYRHANLDPEARCLRLVDPVAAAQFAAQHYELAPLRRLSSIEVDPEEHAHALRLCDEYPEITCPGVSSRFWIDGPDRLVVVEECDLHFELVLGLDNGPMLERAIPSALGVGYAMCPSDTLWFFLRRYYREVALGHSTRSLRFFAQVAPVLTETIDWDIVTEAASVFEIRPALFYYLSFLASLRPELVPPALLDELSPHQRTHETTDHGWQLSRMLGVREPLPFPRPAFLPTA